VGGVGILPRMPRTRSRRDEIAALLAPREREGLTYEDLAAVSGLKRSTLTWWAWRLRREDRERAPFAEAVVVDEEDVVESGPESGIRIRCGHITVDVAPDFDVRALRRVLDAVAGVSC